MIRYFRALQEGPITSFVTFFIAAAMMLWGVEKLFVRTSTQLPQVDVMLDRYAVSLQERANALQEFVHHYHRGETTPSKEQVEQYRKLSNQQLLQEHVMQYYINKIDCGIHPKVLQQILLQNGSFTAIKNQLKLGESSNRGQGMLRGLDVKMQQMQRQMNKHLLHNALLEGFLNPPKAIDEIDKIAHQRRSFSWLAIPAYQVSQLKKQQPSPKDIETYYSKHPQYTPDKIQLQYIHVSSSQLQGSAQRELKLQQLTEQVLIHPTDINTVATKLGLKVATTALFAAQEDGVEPVIAKPEVLKQAFSDQTAKKRLVSEPIVLANGDIVVIQALQFKLGKLLLLNEVKDKIRQTLQLENAVQQQQKLIRTLQDQLKKSTISIAECQRQLGATLHHSKPISQATAGAQQKELSTEMMQLGFSTPSDQTGWQHAILYPDMQQQQWILFSLQKAASISNNTATTVSESTNADSIGARVYAQLLLDQFSRSVYSNLL